MRTINGIDLLIALVSLGIGYYVGHRLGDRQGYSQGYVAGNTHATRKLVNGLHGNVKAYVPPKPIREPDIDKWWPYDWSKDGL